MLSSNDLLAIKKIVKEEIHGIEEELSGKIAGVEERLNGKIAKVQETIDIVQSVMVEHHSKLEQRVTNIEEELHIPKN